MGEAGPLLQSPPPVRRYLLFAALYLSEGAPIGFVWWALPTMLRASGVPVGEIAALTSLLVLPWALKFLWAPVVDVLRTPRFGHRGWIACAQVGMGACLVPLLFLDLERDFAVVYGLLLLHAVFAATQDVAVDALCMAHLVDRERGRANAWMQGGMLLGRGAFGGGTILVAQHIGFAGVVAILIGCIWASLALLVVWRGELGPPRPPEGGRAVARALGAALSAPKTWLALAFAATAGAAYEGAALVAGPFLLDHGVSTAAVGWFFTVTALAAMAAGAGLGGWLADRRGHGRTTAGAQLAIVAIVGALAAAEAAGAVGPVSAYAAYTALYVAIGGFTAASYALLMRVADGAARATAFSAFMAMTNVCEMWSGRVVGATHDDAGYALGFALLGGASLAAIALLYLLARPKTKTAAA